MGVSLDAMLHQQLLSHFLKASQLYKLRGKIDANQSEDFHV